MSLQRKKERQGSNPVEQPSAQTFHARMDWNFKLNHYPFLAELCRTPGNGLGGAQVVVAV